MRHEILKVVSITGMSQNHFQVHSRSRFTKQDRDSIRAIDGVAYVLTNNAYSIEFGVAELFDVDTVRTAVVAALRPKEECPQCHGKGTIRYGVSKGPNEAPETWSEPEKCPVCNNGIGEAVKED